MQSNHHSDTDVSFFKPVTIPASTAISSWLEIGTAAMDFSSPPLPRSSRDWKVGWLQPVVLLRRRLWRGAPFAGGISSELGNARLYVTSWAVALSPIGAGFHWLPAGPVLGWIRRGSTRSTGVSRRRRGRTEGSARSRSPLCSGILPGRLVVAVESCDVESFSLAELLGLVHLCGALSAFGGIPCRGLSYIPVAGMSEV